MLNIKESIMKKYGTIINICFVIGVATAWIATHYPSVWDNYFKTLVCTLIVLTIISIYCIFKIENISLSSNK